MARPTKFTKLGVIKRQIRESIDLDYYDLMWALCLFMSGEKDTIERAMKGRVLDTTNRVGSGNDLPDYGDIMPGIGQVGTQNHGLVNARIMNEGLAMEPDFTFSHPDPLIRAVNQAYVRDLWISQSWDEPMMMTGMEVEATGISGFAWGVDNERPDGRHCSVFDTVWDRGKKEPGKWRWVCTRRRLDVEEAKDLYPDALTKAEWDSLVSKEISDPRSGADHENTRRVRRDVIVEWSYYSKDEHVVWLGGTQGASDYPLKLNDRYQYRKAGSTASPNDDDATAGPNPFGVIPHSFWTDGWTPGVHRPASKTETSIRIAAMLNEVEHYIVNCFRMGAPYTSVDTSRIDDEKTLEDLKGANSYKRLEEILLINGGGVKDVLERTDPVAAPEIAVFMRNMLKDELNATTGVGDMERGQALGGERRTRFEVSALMDQSGVQARHARRRYALFLRDSVNIVRTIGARHDTAKRVLALPDMDPLDLNLFPIGPFLSIDIPVEVNPNSLVFKTEDDRRNEAIIEMQQVHTPYIQMGVMDPNKSMAMTLKKLGYPNGRKQFGFDQAPMMGGTPPQPGEPPQPGGAPGQPAPGQVPSGIPGTPTGA